MVKVEQRGFVPRTRQAHARQRRSIAFAQLTAALALVLSIAVVIMAVSLGLARAHVLGSVVGTDGGRLALFGLVPSIVGMGWLISTLMRLTAPVIQSG
jgi:hypothetical protein